MINARTELQYRIALGIIGQMLAAGLVTEEEAAAIRRLAAEKYQPVTVWEYPGLEMEKKLC